MFVTELIDPRSRASRESGYGCLQFEEREESDEVGKVLGGEWSIVRSPFWGDLDRRSVRWYLENSGKVGVESGFDDMGIRGKGVRRSVDKGDAGEGVFAVEDAVDHPSDVGARVSANVQKPLLKVASLFLQEKRVG